MRPYQRKIINWLTVLAWLGVIYYFSNQPDLASPLEPIWDIVLRKIAHAAEYFVLTYLLNRAILGQGVARPSAAVVSVLLSIAYALTDEWHQGFIRGRVASLWDIGVDSSGTLLMWLLLHYEHRSITTPSIRNIRTHL